MNIALGIILAITTIVLVYLFIIVVRGGNKNSQSFQKELALRNAKKDSKQLAKDYVEGKITYEELSEKIYNQETLRRVKVNEEKAKNAKETLEKARAEFNVVCSEIVKLENALKNADASSDKVQKIKAELVVERTKADNLKKEIKTNDSLYKQLNYDLKLIISNYAYGAIAGTSSTKLTRSEKVEEKAAVKAAMKEKKAAWKAEDEEYYATVKTNIASLKVEVAESKVKLKDLELKYLEEKKVNIANLKTEVLEYKTKLQEFDEQHLDQKKATSEQMQTEAYKNYAKERESLLKAYKDSKEKLDSLMGKKAKRKKTKSGSIQIEDPLQIVNHDAISEEEDETRVNERAYREYLKEHERLVQKYRIEKNRISITRRVERWSKRGGHLRREIFVKRQYYYLVAPYTILFMIFTVLPVLMSLYFSFTYFNLLEAPTFIGWENYMRLFVDDKVFIIAIRNTAILAVITGPLSYLMSFVFAWLINELRPLVRSIMTLIFYAPSISGNVYLVWKLIFSSDIYGYANSILIKLNFIKEPITWLEDSKYIIWILIIVQLWLSLGVSFLSFIAGLQGVNRELYEAGAIDGVKNRWQELWYITLPQMKSQLLFGAVMQITSSLAVAEVSTQIAGFPSIEYAGHTIITHLMDYGSVRMEMGYASAIATILFIVMIVANLLVRKILRRVGS